MRLEVDERTAEYFREIAKQKEQRGEELHYVTGPCKCQICMAKRQQEIREKVFGNSDADYLLLSSDPNLWEMAKRHHKQ